MNISVIKRKFLKSWEAHQAHSGKYNFPKWSFLHERLGCVIENKYSWSIFSYSGSLTLFIYEKMSARHSKKKV